MTAEGEAFRRLLAGDAAGAREALGRAQERYRASWEIAPPRSFGRLVALLKAAVIASPEEAAAAAAYARLHLPEPCDSPTSCYAAALVALVEGDDAAAAHAAAGMRDGDAAFGRAAEALDALAARDAPRYGEAVRAIVDDFAARDAHLTGVAIADTALMMERLAERRGIAARPRSPVMPG